MTDSLDAKNPFLASLGSLDALYETAWSALEAAADSPEHCWNKPVLSTVDDGRPRGRTIVIRGVDRSTRVIWFHTDARSSKLTEIAAQPEVAWTFYDLETRVQATLHATASIHVDDAIADAGWQASRVESLRCYLAPEPPGQMREEPTVNLPDSVLDRIPSTEEVTAGRDCFAVVQTVVTSLEILILQRSGNLRARYTWTGNAWQKNWVTP